MLEIIIASISIITVLVISLLRHRELQPHWLQIFPWFLALTLLIQPLGYFYSKLQHGKSNHFIFNFYTIVEYGFYLTIYYLALHGSKFQKIILLLGLCFLLVCMWEFLPPEYFFQYSIPASNTGKVVTLVGCLLLLTHWLQADEKIDLLSLPMFWITAGIMVTVVTEFIQLSFFDYIRHLNLDPGGQFYGYFTTSACVVQYGMFALAFLIKSGWKRPNYS